MNNAWNNMEAWLRQKKDEIDQLHVPDEMETRLRCALEKSSSAPDRKRNWKPKIAVLCVLALLAAYQSDTLAFYGKRLVGYDPVMNGTLKQLNQLGKGQSINKSYTYKNGITLKLDGIMVDDNQLLAYYSISKSAGTLDIMATGTTLSIKGRINEYRMNWSQGLINDSETEIKYMASFNPPYFFEKELSLVYRMENGKATETGSIAFTLDRSLAMGHTLKKDLRKSVQVDETNIHFETITATPTKTVIKGSLQSPLKLARDHIMQERFRPQNMEVELIANGKKFECQGSGMSTNINGMKFELEYDVLPYDLKDLQLKLVKFSADHDVKQKYDLQVGQMNQSHQIMGQTVFFEQLYTSGGDTYLTISSEESVVLTNVYLMMDEKRVSLEETIRDEYDKKTDGTIIHTRTLHFPGSGQKYQLDIQRMTYAKTYNKRIVIPVN